MADSSKVELLKSFGVFPKAAQRYAIDQEKWVEPVVRRYREMVVQNYQVDNPAGMIIKMLKDPESFGVTLEEPRALPAVAVSVSKTPVEVKPTITEEQALPTVRFLVQNLKGLPVRHQDAFPHRLENEPGLMHDVLKKFTAAGADTQTRSPWCVNTGSWIEPRFAATHPQHWAESRSGLRWNDCGLGTGCTPMTLNVSGFNLEIEMMQLLVMMGMCSG